MASTLVAFDFILKIIKKSVMIFQVLISIYSDTSLKKPLKFERFLLSIRFSDCKNSWFIKTFIFIIWFNYNIIEPRLPNVVYFEPRLAVKIL
jgi:hypothetical protein